jgi:integrase
MAGTAASTSTKSEKPLFPLFRHASGQWAKKIRGRTHYFGVDQTAALAKYSTEREDLEAGRVPKPAEADALTVKDLVNRFLSAKLGLRDSGELSPRTWSDYYSMCERLIESLGRTRAVENLGSDDFDTLRRKLAKVRGPVSLGNEIQRIRTLFKFALDDGLIDRPVKFGAGFKKPSRKTLRAARHEAGSRVIDAQDLQKLLAKAGTNLKAMILLGLNCGFGQTDISCLPLKALDLKAGWVNFPRPKTAVPRRCPLWPETVKAVRAALKSRPAPNDAENRGIAFITRHGCRWVRVTARDGKLAVIADSVNAVFQKLMNQCGVNRRGLGFYALRHTFRTIADGSKDQPAIDSIMGHVDESMGARYREGIDDQRLRDVVEVVRTWLFKKTP